jgi:flagellar hook assembly protein FlgD
VFDIRGRRVTTLHQGAIAEGTTQFQWDGRDAQGVRMPAGIYLYRLTMGRTVLTRRLVLIPR